MPPLPLQLSDASGVPRYRQIVDQLTDLIRTAQLAPGDQLPSVRDLAAQLLVSLITTRRAYADLEAAGLIVRRQGHGTFVSDALQPVPRDQARDEASTAIGEALDRARRLGFTGDRLHQLVQERLDEQEGS
jgi:GntR family transcriptional regulator